MFFITGFTKAVQGMAIRVESTEHKRNYCWVWYKEPLPIDYIISQDHELHNIVNEYFSNA